jgi:hypothetical protein
MSMPAQTPDHDDTNSHATSPGNEGARGSRGEANTGAQPGGPGSAPADQGPKSGPDLREADAQGGGGIASDSSRSS